MKHSHNGWRAETREMNLGEYIEVLEAAQSGDNLMLARTSRDIFEYAENAGESCSPNSLPMSVYRKFVEEAVESWAVDPNSEGG